MAHHQNDWSLARSFTPKTGIPIMQWRLSSWSDCQSAVSDIATHWSHSSVLIHHMPAYPNQSLNHTTMGQWQSGVNIPLDGVCRSKSACITSTVSGGMMGFTKALAHEVGPRVTANMVATGHIRTDDIDRVCPDILESCMKSIPLKCMGIPEDIAD